MRMANWVRHTKPSFVSEVLEFARQDDVISFAGGQTLDVRLCMTEETKEAYETVLNESAKDILRYSQSEGEEELRRAIATVLTEEWCPTHKDDVVVTNGSQQALDLIAKAFLRPGDVIAIESPTGLGAISAFTPYHPLFVAVPCDEEGMLVSHLEQVLRQHRPRFVYLMSTFHNPTGRTMGLERRKRIVGLCKAAGVPIVEHNSYEGLGFHEHSLPTLRSLSDEVIYVGSLSKTLSPGLRIGWIVGKGPVREAVKLGIQATCQGISVLNQRAAAKLLLHPNYKAHVGSLVAAYAERMDALLQAVRTELPEGCTWRSPAGGPNLWLRLPEGVSALDLLSLSMEKNTVFLPGRPFYIEEHPESEQTLRLNVTNASSERIMEGIARMGESLRQLLGVPHPVLTRS